MTDVLTPEQRLRCMRSNKSFGTRPELALGRLLWRAGVRYRKHPRSVAGRPDFCIKKYRLAIFVDGEFWHGRDWPAARERFKTRREFWIAKIERNIARDRRVNAELTAAGWQVMRFWESDIRRNPGTVVSEVLRYLSEVSSRFAPEYIPSDYEAADGYAVADSPSAMAAEPSASYGEPPS